MNNRTEVDKKKVGLIGHSEGGLLALQVASVNKDLAFIVLLAGPGIKGADVLSGQVRAALLSRSKQPKKGICLAFGQLY